MLLSVNAGSSSLKLALFDAAAEAQLWDGSVAEIGGSTRMKTPAGASDCAAADHVAALECLRDAMQGDGFGFDALAGVGHRVVHGGAKMTVHARLDDAVRAEIARCAAFAPLHNPAALAGMDAIAALAPSAPQIACFDTAFHARTPETTAAYALPAALRAKGYRRYGFHGLSYEGLVAALPEALGAPPPERVLALHLGNGASVTAIRDGVGVGSSMGFSPLDGLTMGTRSGAIDPALVLHLARELGVDETDRLLTRESGLKGLSGGVSDMRELETRAAAGDADAAFAIAHFHASAVREAGALIALMGGVDLLAFTGGIGEHSEATRRAVASALDWTGASTIIIPADEERVIARATARLLGAA